MRVVQVVKACSTEQATSKDSVSGSVTGVLRDQPEADGGLAPHALDVGLHRLEPLGLQLIDAPSAFCPLGDESGVLQQAEVPRHRGPADRHGVGDLADGEALGAEQPEDRPAVRVAQRLERIGNHRATVTLELPIQWRRWSSLTRASSPEESAASGN